MRKSFVLKMALLVAVALIDGDALAAGSRSGGHGGGHSGARGGAHHGGPGVSHGGNRGTYRGGYGGSHYGGYHGYYRPFYGSLAITAPYFAYPRFYNPPPLYEAPLPPDVLYYCPQYDAYYPQVPDCPGGWQRLSLQAAPPAPPALAPMPPY